MKKDLIERLLNEQTTPDEEHLVAQMLQQGEDMEQWLTEDETAEYDRIVSQRRAKRRQLRWAIAAVIVALIVVGTIVLWPKEQVGDTIVATKTEKLNQSEVSYAELDNSDARPSVAVIAPAKLAVSPKGIAKRVKQQPKANTTDSLQYYIARLEKELENVNESTYAVKAEEVLRADARLQKLVQRIMMGELTKDDVPAEAMNTNQIMEEQP
jgi:hypothetical protein